MFDFAYEVTVRPDDLDAPFDDRMIAALRALIAQGEWSMRRESDDPAEGTRCVYRGPEGRKCLVGFLIPDDRYASTAEGYTGFDLPSEYWTRNRASARKGSLLGSLQSACHDAICGEPFNAQRIIENAIIVCVGDGAPELARRIEAEIRL